MAVANDLPNGVRPETAMLISGPDFPVGPNNETLRQAVSWDIGPGFAVGIHMLQAGLLGANLAVNSFVNIAFSLDPDAVSLTLSRQSQIPVYQERTETSGTTIGATLPHRNGVLYFDVPIFTVQNSVWLASSGNDQSTKPPYVRAYYRIYSVPTDFFVRIAGISLSRG